MIDNRPTRLKRFSEILSEPDIDLDGLGKISWTGIPDEVRAETWKILLGYLPKQASRREKVLKRKRDEYRRISKRHSACDNWAVTKSEKHILRQVKADVPRTAPYAGLFRDKRVQKCLERLLFTWALRHPSTSYVQGMNDIVTPLFAVFLSEFYDGQNMLDGKDIENVSLSVLEKVEADSYWCFSKVLSGILGHYVPDLPGIHNNIKYLEQLVRKVDYDLCSHLMTEGVEVTHFSFKWMNCLLVREMPFSCVIRIWDTYMSEGSVHGFKEFHVYVCAAFMCHFSKELQKMDYEKMYTFWQRVPTEKWLLPDIEILLGQAYVWYTLFHGSQAHLNYTPMIRTETKTNDEKNLLPLSLMHDGDFMCNLYD